MCWGDEGSVARDTTAADRFAGPSCWAIFLRCHNRHRRHASPPPPDSEALTRRYAHQVGRVEVAAQTLGRFDARKLEIPIEHAMRCGSSGDHRHVAFGGSQRPRLWRRLAKRPTPQHRHRAAGLHRHLWSTIVAPKSEIADEQHSFHRGGNVGTTRRPLCRRDRSAAARGRLSAFSFVGQAPPTLGYCESRSKLCLCLCLGAVVPLWLYLSV